MNQALMDSFADELEKIGFLSTVGRKVRGGVAEVGRTLVRKPASGQAPAVLRRTKKKFRISGGTRGPHTTPPGVQMSTDQAAALLRRQAR